MHMKRTFSACLCVGLACLTAHRSAAAGQNSRQPLKVTVEQSLQKGEISVKLTVVNASRTCQIFQSISCSWQDFWQTDNRNVLVLGQRSAAKPPSKSGKSPDANDAALLRKKLDALEQILVQNQQENTRLRQQLKALGTQNRKAAGAAIVQMSEAQRSRALAVQAEDAARRAKESTVSPAAQLNALQAVLEDLKRQQSEWQTRLQNSDMQYRSGLGNYQNSSAIKAEVDICRLQIDAVQKQIEDVKSGRKTSLKEQNLSLLRLQIAELQAKMQREQESLIMTKTRCQAGAASASDLSQDELRVTRLQTQIDQLRVQISQENAH